MGAAQPAEVRASAASARTSSENPMFLSVSAILEVRVYAILDRLTGLNDVVRVDTEASITTTNFDIILFS
jgi:hypothetical protein